MKKYLLILIACFCSIAASNANAEDYLFDNSNSTIYDTFIYDKNPTSSFGSDSRLNVEEDYTGDKRAYRTLIKFDDIFGSKKGRVAYGSNIESATLSLKTGTWSWADSSDFLYAYTVNTDWNESTTWNNFGSVAGGLAGTDWTADYLDYFMPLNKGGIETLDISNAVAAWSNQTADNNGIVLISSGKNWASFYSSESTNSPTLSISATAVAPEPASVILGLLGGLGMFIRKRFF